jgi:pimeloyl-ACP methyl ester carboxylesterase
MGFAVVLAAGGVMPLSARTAAEPGAITFSSTPIVWEACPDAPVAGLECAVYDVPLDYRDPAGETIQLALRRMPASGPDRIGTLFFNPGGPGGTGTGQFVEWLGQFPAPVREQFDLVSWDPRGVGESTSVQCFDNPDAEGQVLGAVGAFPLSYAEQATFNATWRQVADACAAAQPGLLAHVSTADTARDLEQLRIAAGGDDLNYWGVSYGTFLGATYANMFPDHIRTLVLDGNLSPLAWTADGNPSPQESIGLRIGSQQAADVFSLFLQTCTAAGKEACPFAESSVELTTQKWVDLLNRLSQGPVTLQTGEGPVVMDLGTLVEQVDNSLDIVWPIPGASGWPRTAAALQAVHEAANVPGVAATPAPAQDLASPVAAGGREVYAGPEQTFAVACGDAARPPLERIPSLATDSQLEAGYWGLSTLYNDVPCTFWSVAAADPYVGPWDTPLSASPLIVNTTHDPSTPMQNAERMAELLPGSVLLRVNGYGHTSLLNTSTCANDLISAYLIDEVLPAPGTWCAQDRQPFQD